MITSHYWIGLALLSALFTSARHLYIKRHCSQIPAEMLIFFTRGLGAMLYLFIAIQKSIVIFKPLVFWPVTLLTVFLTALATILQIRMIQKHPVSLMVPLLSFIPVFMIPWTLILFREIPTLLAFLGILLVCAGAMLLQLSKPGKYLKNIQKIYNDKQFWIMIFVASLLGLTTTLDRVAIEASSPLTYALLWSLISTFVMAFLTFRKSVNLSKSGWINHHSILQGIFWAGAFLCQMIAIGKTLTIPSGVTYVKMITLFHILLSVVVGGVYFKEKYLLKRLLSTLMMIAGAGFVLMFR